jgi:hypothetical protein
MVSQTKHILENNTKYNTTTEKKNETLKITYSYSNKTEEKTRKQTLKTKLNISFL